MFSKIKAEIPSATYSIGKIIDDMDGLKIEITNENFSFLLQIESRDAFFIMTESAVPPENWEGCEPEWPIYITERSKMLDFYHSYSNGIYGDLNYKHIRIFAENEIIDIISVDTPEIIIA